MLQLPKRLLYIFCCQSVLCLKILMKHADQRAEESLQRYSGFLNKKYGYMGECWISKQFKDVWTASPLYDWTNNDVWAAYYQFGYKYNRLYDLYYKAGLNPSQILLNCFAKSS